VNELLADFGTNQLVGFILVLARLTPLFLFAPLFSSKLVPMRVRGIVAVALAIGMAPLALAGAEPPTDALGLGGLVVKELLVGLAFAFAVGMLLAALQVAGSFVDTLIGFAFGAAVDPLTGNQGTVMSQLYGIVGVLVFVAINGDQIVIRGFAETYELVGLLEMPALGALLDGAIAAFTGLFAAALQVAAPVLLALILTDAAFGLVTRVVPQLNVFSVGLPAKVLVGMLVSAASLPFVAGWVSDELETSVRVALGSLGVS
jgi:flagellar biosynthesis protein FliR